MIKEPNEQKLGTYTKRKIPSGLLNKLVVAVVMLVSFVAVTSAAPNVSAAGKFVTLVCSDGTNLSYDLTGSVLTQNETCANAGHGTYVGQKASTPEPTPCDANIAADRPADFRAACGSGDPALNCDPTSNSNCNFFEILIGLVNIVSGLIGVVVVLNIVIGGIQYTTAGDNPNKVQAARQKITNSIIALIAFAFSVVALPWIVTIGVL